MPNATAFKVYDASAGSGKTYTLVKEYLKILFASNTLNAFKNILAITFTNKAVAEMKERIIEMLKQFSNTAILDDPNTMFRAICEELNLMPNQLQDRAKILLEVIVHNYAAFDISTIDGFTHKLIRTFATDLKLPLNFEVELDQESLINEAVDNLIAKAGTDKKLTEVLVDFAIEKADDDKSWDVSLDFNKIGKLLTNENDIPFIDALKDKTLDDFKVLKKQLKTDMVSSKSLIVKHAEQVLNLLIDHGLEFSDFSRSTLPNHFKKALELNLNRLYDNQLETNLSERKSIYNTSLDSQKKQVIDDLLPQIEAMFHKLKKEVYHFKFLKNFYGNITPLSVLNAINIELNALKKEQNKMLISEFNTIISDQIKEQPAPFIYERIGEKFRHYFIDEFQDTSVMQWQNLIPLLNNSLSSETGSTMVVGDVKQAIYRWRGGKAEQFIGLINDIDNNPFQIKKHVETLPNNFRSKKEIVEFNNNFFDYLADQVFSNNDYKALYKKVNQNAFQTSSGYVNITFLEFNKDEDRDELYAKMVLEKINTCIENGFEFGDICVLVRKKKEGVAVANHLSDHGIPIVSSETLLIKNSPEVTFINNMLTLLVEPKNSDAKLVVLNYFASAFNIVNKHSFFKSCIQLPLDRLFKNFQAFGVQLDHNRLMQNSLYDIIECLIRQFNLTKSSNGYLQFYLDFVLDYVNKKGSDIIEFLEYFKRKSESLSIVSPKGQNAVQIMTIHKSKGLEFPVVIFPYADLDIYSEIDPKEWYPLHADFYDFTHTLLNYNKDFEYYSGKGPSIYSTHQSQLELDNINLLYVALTRPIEQLYVITKKDVSAKGETNQKKYSGLFINFLKQQGLWNDSVLNYEFGKLQPKTLNSHKPDRTIIPEDFLSVPKEVHDIKIVTKSGYLWDTNQQLAIEKGNLIHTILSYIKTIDNIESVVNNFVNESLLNQEEAAMLNKTIETIVSHKELSPYFKHGSLIYNEKDIIDKNGVILRPDRVVINTNNEAVIIDYKTGKEDNKYFLQLQSYQDVLESMKYTVVKKILVYINDTITVNNA